MAPGAAGAVLVVQNGEGQTGASKEVARRQTRLRQSGLVVDRRDAQWVRYRLNPAMPPAVGRLLEAALELPLRQESLAA